MNDQKISTNTERESFEGEITKKPTSNWKSNPWTKELVSISIILAVIFILRSSIFNFYVIPTGSMIPTIKINDRVFANKLAYGLMLPFMDSQIVSWSTPHRGDIVLFQSPRDDTTFVKRVIGVENDKISFLDGKLVINGTPVEETEVTDRSLLADQEPIFTERTLFLEKNLGQTANDEHYIARGKFSGDTFQNNKTYVVPPGSLFCMGDNRDGSHDSRAWGFVEAKKVYGKALWIIWSTKDYVEEYDPATNKNRLVKDNGILPSFRFERFFQKLK